VKLLERAALAVSLFLLVSTAPARAAAETTAPSATPATPARPLENRSNAKLGLLPVELSAFADVYYQFTRPAADDFHVGSAELDASLALTSFVNASTAVLYTGDGDRFGVGAFVIDCGIAGDTAGFPFKTKLLRKSGVALGRFDVPFGVAYLEYPSVENRLVSLPQAVLATHGAWNDTGAQFYAVSEHWTAIGYVVNGRRHPLSPGESAPARSALGGRASAKLDDVFELGASTAWHFDAGGPVMFFGGADFSGSLGPLDLRGEYLLKHVKVAGLPELTHGAYLRSLLRLDPAFLMARYDSVLEGSRVLDRRIAAGGGAQIFSQGELRAVYEQSLDSELRSVTLQLVVGSSFQPTGLRR
jgi:hypothetical protein